MRFRNSRSQVIFGKHNLDGWNFWVISCSLSQNLDELLGKLFIEIEMPEKPKESFFAGLFGVGVRNVDREELCKHFFLNFF